MQTKTINLNKVQIDGTCLKLRVRSEDKVQVEAVERRLVGKELEERRDIPDCLLQHILQHTGEQDAGWNLYHVLIRKGAIELNYRYGESTEFLIKITLEPAIDSWLQCGIWSDGPRAIDKQRIVATVGSFGAGKKGASITHWQPQGQAVSYTLF